MTREELIIPLIKDKIILDVGSVNEDGQHSLWKLMKQHAASLDGIDTRDSSDPNIIKGNVETFNFTKTYDIVVLGDVLVQTSNQGLMLDNVKRALKENGRLIITLPNAKWWTVFLRPSSFQTGWHDRFTLKYLLIKHGFKIVRLSYYYGNRHSYKFLRKLIVSQQSMLVICENDYFV